MPSSDNNLIDILDSRVIFFCFFFLSPFDSTQILGISNDRMNAFGAWDSVGNVFCFLLFHCLIFWQSRVGFPACIRPDGANSGRGSAAKHAVKKWRRRVRRWGRQWRFWPSPNRVNFSSEFVESIRNAGYLFGSGNFGKVAFHFLRQLFAYIQNQMKQVITLIYKLMQSTRSSKVITACCVSLIQQFRGGIWDVGANYSMTQRSLIHLRQFPSASDATSKLIWFFSRAKDSAAFQQSKMKNWDYHWQWPAHHVTPYKIDHRSKTELKVIIRSLNEFWRPGQFWHLSGVVKKGRGTCAPVCVSRLSLE